MSLVYVYVWDMCVSDCVRCVQMFKTKHISLVCECVCLRLVRLVCVLV